jgi:hypothetical protein
MDGEKKGRDQLLSPRIRMLLVCPKRVVTLGGPKLLNTRAAS